MQAKIYLLMTAQENEQRLMAYIINQSNRTIDYEWEIQHHKEMHAAYEKSLLCRNMEDF